MGKRKDWPSAETVSAMLDHIRVNEADILKTHFLIGTEKDCQVVMVQNGRLFGLLGDDAYLNTLAGALKAAGKPIYPSEEDIPSLTIGDVEVEDGPR